MPNPDHTRRASELYWQLAVTRKLYDSALAAGRYEDVNYYARCLTAFKARAQSLLKSKAELAEFPSLSDPPPGDASEVGGSD